MAKKENNTPVIRACYWFNGQYLCLGRLFSRKDLEEYAASKNMKLNITEKKQWDK
jgi:hypothetical protein